MPRKIQNAIVKPVTAKKFRKSTASRETDIETAIRRALTDIRRMSQTERRQSLIDAGILTKDGELAEIYR